MPNDSDTFTIVFSRGPLISRPILSVSLCKKHQKSAKKLSSFFSATWRSLWPKGGLGSLASTTATRLKKDSPWRQETKNNHYLDLIILIIKKNSATNAESPLTSWKCNMALCTYCILFWKSLREQKWVFNLRLYLWKQVMLDSERHNISNLICAFDVCCNHY